MRTLFTSPIAFIINSIKPQIKQFIVLIITTIFWSINQSFFPFIIRKIIKVMEYTPKDKIYLQLILLLSELVTIWVLAEIFIRIQGYLIAHVMPKFQSNIRSLIFSQIQNFSSEHLSNQSLGGMANKIINLPQSCYTLILISLFNFLPIFSSFIISTILTIFCSKPIYGIIIIFWIFCYIGFSLKVAKKSHKYSIEYAERTGKLNNLIFDNIVNALIIKLFTSQTVEKKSFMDIQSLENQSAIRLGMHVEKTKSILSLFSLSIMTLLLFLSVKDCINEKISLGDFTFIIMLSVNILGFTWAVAQQIPIFYKELGNLKDAISLLAGHGISSPNKTSADKTPLQITEGTIEFKNIYFNYNNQNSLFKNINFYVKAKQKIGIVGLSGSGKTTLVKLLLKLYEPQSGSILIDGQDLRYVFHESILNQISVIPQEPQLFNRSILENISYGNLSASIDDIINAAKISLCDDFIRKLSDGYDSIVGELGSRLSAGQRQRIAIARAILKNSKIIVFDESTSAIDLITENNLHNNLSRFIKDKTVIIIAHRLASLVDVDRIYVFNDGNLQEEGTHRDLLKIKGMYFQMWHSQKEQYIV